jgi:hypothetical protein
MLPSLLVGALLTVGQTGNPPSEARIYTPAWSQSVSGVGVDGDPPSDRKRTSEVKKDSLAQGTAELPKTVIILTQGGGVPTQAPQAAPAQGPVPTLSLFGYPQSPTDQATAGGAQKVAEKPEYRRAMPSPWDSPPIPGSEYQGYPIIGVPPDFTMWPLMKAVQGTPYGDLLLSNKIRVYGWITAEANWSTSRNTNTPDSYWIRPKTADLD